LCHREISSAIERLQQLLCNSNREKERLMKENESLRCELERVRKQGVPSNSILKSPSLSLTSPDRSRPSSPIHLDNTGDIV
jgi:hypothetical protein